MSTTNDYGKVIRICACYEARGMTGIEILEIDTTGAEWDGDIRVWEVQQLLHCLGLQVLQRKKYLKNEYLVEKYIPSSRVTRRTLWDQVKDGLDPGGIARAAARREFKQTRKRKERDDNEPERNERTRSFKCLRQT
ncbi:hypothetical protein VPNG_10191 [Cytospora leucostoma]|uniref:Uncharacterized protein n=1 Tax=Cytospora leucostoma TaxID=1230097 RepID=A0A423VFF8_9PEZI|nr:hypothetical protein VPNG_10191 [Cytospora leucostoma]